MKKEYIKPMTAIMAVESFNIICTSSDRGSNFDPDAMP